MSPAYGKVGKQQPMAGFIDSANFPQHGAAPGATYTALLPLPEILLVDQNMTIIFN